MGQAFQWDTRHARVMGILNVTPDSFSDGGQFVSLDQALAQAQRLVGAGADILDIGGESSRPGAEPVSAEEERRRVVPLIEQLHRQHPGLLISVDTTKAEVAAAALAAGARVVNDISAAQWDPGMLAVVREAQAGLVLMHMAGTPRTMQQDPRYGDVVAEVGAFLERRVAAAEQYGLARSQLAVDPGIGFGKTLEHNVALLAQLPRVRPPGCALLVGTSRKSFLGKLLGRELDQRLAGSLATVAWALVQEANVVRVHDVAETVDVVRLIERLRQAVTNR